MLNYQIARAGRNYDIRKNRQYRNIYGVGLAGSMAYRAGQNYYQSYGKQSKQSKPSEKTGTLQNKAYKPRRVKPTRVKTNKNLSKEVKSIKKRVADLSKMDDATTGTLTYRLTEVQDVLTAINKQKTYSAHLNRSTEIENVMAQLKFFNTADGLLVTTSGAAGTYQRNIWVKYSSIVVTVRNNYQIPAHVDFYYATVKDDTDQTIEQAWTAGVPDGSNLTDTTDLNQYPTDYNLVNDLYKVKKIKSILLEPGSEHSVKQVEKGYNYDPATFDTHGLFFQKEYKAGQVLVVLRGTLSHDPNNDQQGISNVGLDVSALKTYKVKYSAGTNITYSYVDNNYDDMPNNAKVANKPVADNQEYSKV